MQVENSSINNLNDLIQATFKEYENNINNDMDY